MLKQLLDSVEEAEEPARKASSMAASNRSITAMAASRSQYGTGQAVAVWSLN
jgi:hypothetical protein